MPDPFISRSDLSNYLGRGPNALDNDEGALICVDAACDIVRTGASQILTEVEEDVITLDGSGTDALSLPQHPVSAVSSIVNGNDEEIDPDGWTLSEVGVLLRPGGTWTKGRQNFTVTYTHGYADEDLPRDVRMVALSVASRMFMQGPNVFESIGKRQVRYAGPAMDLSKTELAILRKYKPT